MYSCIVKGEGLVGCVAHPFSDDDKNNNDDDDDDEYSSFYCIIVIVQTLINEIKPLKNYFCVFVLFIHQLVLEKIPWKTPFVVT